MTRGDVFAGYVIERLLGTGAMGEVYLAKHPRLPRSDALKILPDAATTDCDFRERFLREADLVAGLWHPNIVQVHDRGEFDGQLWIAMDHVEGFDAARFVETKYPNGMPVEEACAIVSAVADALDYAHRLGLLHRDVKPANILLTNPEYGSRRILLADFGIARQLMDTTRLTATNVAMGTVAYAAPEQLMGADVDGRTDQYALAATAFHILTGALPYQHSNPVAVISQHLSAAPPELAVSRPELKQLDPILAKALAKNPGDRFSSCQEFAEALRLATSPDFVRAAGATTQAAPKASNHHEGTLTQAATLTPPRPTLAPAPVQTSRLPWIVAGVAVAAMTMLMVLIVAMALGTRQARTDSIVATPTAGATTVPAAIPRTVTVTPSTTSSSATVLPVQRPGPVLEGSYRVDLNFGARTINGVPSPSTNVTAWWAFRSACTSSGCVATATKIDENGQQAPTQPGSTGVFRFVSDHWEDSPASYPGVVSCPAGGTVPVTMVGHSAWFPQPDGTFEGVQVASVQTMVCGVSGEVFRVPFTATKVADVPLGVNVEDPVLAGR